MPTHEAGKELQLPAILHKPVGDGPFAAWGYVALQVESFSPRGPRSVETVTPDVACRDAYAAKTYVSALAFVHPENIAVMGWSHGGVAVLSIIDRSLILSREQVIFDGQGLSVCKVSPFKAAVAFSPYCHPLSDPDTPLFVLTGRKDDACPVSLTSYLKKDYAITRTRAYLSKYIGAREPPVR